METSGGCEKRLLMAERTTLRGAEEDKKPDRKAFFIIGNVLQSEKAMQTRISVTPGQILQP